MSASAIDELRVYKRIHDMVFAFGNQDHWTPVVGAMLVCGIRPPNMACDGIPSNALHLLSDGLNASPQQLLRAQDVLNAWRECSTGEEAGLAPLGATPVAFIEWCDEEFGSRIPSRRPQWLAHFVHEMVGQAVGMPPPVDPDFLEKLVELERAAVASPSPNTSVDGSLTKATPSKSRRPNYLHPGPPSRVERALAIAQTELEPAVHFDLDAVRRRFREMLDGDASGDRGELLRVDGLGFICLRSTDGEEVPMSSGALGKLLKRREEACGRQRQHGAVSS